MIRRILTRLKVETIKYFFNRNAQQIRGVKIGETIDPSSNVIILSMVQKKDIDMYLIALKSIIRFIQPKKIVVVADPSIDAESEAILCQQVSGIEVRRAEEFRYSGTPIGGTWERLNAIASYNADHFVIQLDADTITLNQPNELFECIKENKSFVLGTSQGQKLSTLTEAAKFGRFHKKNKRTHIQLEAESLLDELNLPFNYYVRGCSGFTGFSPGSISKEIIVQASTCFYEKLGERWEEWGSEQFMSNLIIANAQSVFVLPIQRYLTPTDAVFTDKAFLHLIGSMRFSNLIYIKAVNHFYHQVM